MKNYTKRIPIPIPIPIPESNRTVFRFRQLFD